MNDAVIALAESARSLPRHLRHPMSSASHCHHAALARTYAKLRAFHRDASFPQPAQRVTLRRLLARPVVGFASMVWETLIVANKVQPIADLSSLALDDARPGQQLRDEQVDRAMSCIRALAVALARQAAREDDANERNAVGSAGIAQYARNVDELGWRLKPASCAGRPRP
jgi:hypothetical protein